MALLFSVCGDFPVAHAIWQASLWHVLHMKQEADTQKLLCI